MQHAGAALAEVFCCVREFAPGDLNIQPDLALDLEDELAADWLRSYVRQCSPLRRRQLCQFVAGHEGRSQGSR